MSTLFSQSSRLGRLNTVLGTDALVLVSFSGEEAMDTAFTWTVECLAPNSDVDFDALLGTHATVTLVTRTGVLRPFDGIVTEAQWLGAGGNGFRYRLILRPWFHLASFRRNQRIFHDKTVIDILTELLSTYSDLGKIEVKTEGDFPQLEYTVQYRESDFDFASRMMERFGISYHFTHEDAGHAMVLTNTAEAHPTVGPRPYRPDEGQYQEEVEHFWIWHPGRRMTTGAIRLTDYNFKSPVSAMQLDQTGDAAHAQGWIESFDYPGDYLDPGRGRAVNRLRIHEERSRDHRFTAEGDIPELGSGVKVSLTGEKVRGIGEDFICISAHHTYGADAYGSNPDDDVASYSAQYEFQSVKRPLVPLRKTRRSIVEGPQTAVVVGEGEIDCDEFGRILVKFHWDLDGAWSMRCRVSQSWAGNGWGGMVIPRIGMEVVVEFIEGDPDQPLVTGCVYNGRNRVPHDLPANKTKSVFKTDTHKGDGYNELTFEDEKEQELIYMRAQKDQQIEILNDRAKSIGRDQNELVGRDKVISVGQDHTETIGRDAKETVTRDVVYNVGQNQIETYGKDHVHNVGNIHKQDIHADHLVQVGRNVEETVFGTYTLDVNQSITTNTKTHTLMAFQTFVIKGPGGKITIDASGISLEAAMIKLKGNVSMGGSGGAQVPTLQGAANQALPLVEECPKEESDS